MTVFCSDTFSRPDGPTLGDTDTGQPWVGDGWGIVAGRGRKGGSEVNAVVTSTGATGEYSVSTRTIPATAGDRLFGPLARYTDATNFVLWERVATATEDAVKLYVRTTAGSFVERGVWGGPLGSTGLDPDEPLDLAIGVDGDALMCSVNGTVRVSYTLSGTEAAALTGDGAGMRDEGTPGYWAEFVVESGSGPVPEVTRYASPEELASWMGRAAFTGLDVQRAELLLDAATSTIENEANQTLAQTTETITVDAWGGYILHLPRWPVTAVTSVTLTADGTVLDSDSYSWTRGGTIVRRGAVWPCAVQAVAVALTAGWEPVPDDMKGLALRLAARCWDNPIGAMSEQLGDRSVQWRVPGMDLTSGEMRLVERYRVHV